MIYVWSRFGEDHETALMSAALFHGGPVELVQKKDLRSAKYLIIDFVRRV